MQKVALFRTIAARHDPEPSIRLARDADATAIEVDAASLVAQYLFPNGDVLLVLDHDCPFEEQLHLVLVRNAAIIDHLTIGVPYASGMFHELEVSDRGLAFRFEGRAVWSVGVDGQGFRILPALPSGAHRRGGWLARHHLLLSRNDP
ncbi:hypothetical protein [Sphingomonas hankookensis]